MYKVDEIFFSQSRQGNDCYAQHNNHFDSEEWRKKLKHNSTFI